jgi:Flp pilus assembly protein TadD
MKSRILNPGFLLAVILALTLWTYWGVRLNPFHFDDALFLESPQVTTPGDPWYLLKPSQSRQLTYLSFYWNYRLCGGRAEGYHLINLLLHCLNVIGIYFFVGCLLKFPPEMEQGIVRRWLPLVSAGIFALHPVQSEVVNYIYQRSALLAVLFSLAALLTFLRFPTAGKSWLWFSVAALFTLLACLSKETALVLPLLMGAFAWLGFAHDSKARPLVRRAQWAVSVMSLFMLSGVGWVLYSLRQKGERTIGLSALRDSFHYLLSQAQVVMAYLRLLLWPDGLVIDHAFKAAPLFSAYSMLCCLFVLALIVFFIAIRRTSPKASVCGLAFFILLAPNSSIIPSADLMFEHRLYLPMIAGSALLGWLLFRACRLLFKREIACEAAWLVVTAGVLIAFSLAAGQRTYVWGDNIRLWSDAAEKVPWNPRAHYNLGVAYLKSDRQKAYQEFQQTVALQPGHAEALYNLGWLEQTAGSLDAARAHYHAAIQADNNHWQAHLNLANLEVVQNHPVEAIHEYRNAIRLRGDCWPAYQSLAAVQIQTGDPNGALATLQKLNEQQPELLEARYLKAYALVQEKQITEAEAEIRFILSHDQKGEYARRVRELQEYLGSLSSSEVPKQR